MREPPFEGGALHLAVDLTEEDLARSVLVRNALVLLGAVSDTDGLKLTARGLARIGAVACQRTSPVGVIRTPLKACIAPRPGNNVSLAGVPRRVSKLHRPWPGGGLPARANSSLVSGAPRLRRRPPRHQALRMWTRPTGRAAPCGPCGQAMEKLRFPTACPHSPLSRPYPHRFCNSDSWERQRHRLQTVPGLLRHPRKSVDGTTRSEIVTIQREKARNNTASLQ